MLLGGPANLTTAKAALLGSHTAGLGRRGAGELVWGLGSQDTVVAEACQGQEVQARVRGMAHLVICWMQCAR